MRIEAFSILCSFTVACVFAETEQPATSAPITSPPVTVAPIGAPITVAPVTSEPAPVTSEPTGSPQWEWIPICFSGESMVEVENKGLVRMADLALGDLVNVQNNKFEPIYSFGHKNAAASATYLRISTKESRSPLEISADHMVTIKDGHNVPASSIKKGDMLFTASGELAVVENVKSVIRKGIFAPFTPSGTIVVNGFVASNYIAYQGSEFLKIGDIETPFSYQWVAHTFKSAHRLAVKMGFTEETYTKEGISNWVEVPHKMFCWVLDQHDVVAFVLISSALAFFVFVSLIECLVSSTTFITLALLGVTTLMTYKKARTSGKKAM